MDFISAIILGAIEGLTEFLPISSTGHMILASHLMKLPVTTFQSTFEISIQLGAILAVVWLFWRKLFLNRDTFQKVVVAFLPTTIIGFALYKIFKSFLAGNTAVTIGALFIGGIFLIWFEKYYQKRGVGELAEENISYRQAAWLGVCQSLAIVPGVSRSAATIIGGLAMKIKREAIVEFSFLLAIPTMAAATAYDLYKSAPTFSGNQFELIGVGFVVSFLVALVAVKFLIHYIQKNDFTAFGWYRIIIAILAYLIFFY
ncbi:MAG: undecaprenyl-diphosphate phosphatase [Candidatus Paceibacterota bacterium]|jgi:undecaprenyl-diphosphatase